MRHRCIEEDAQLAWKAQAANKKSAAERLPLFWHHCNEAQPCREAAGGERHLLRLDSAIPRVKQAFRSLVQAFPLLPCCPVPTRGNPDLCAAFALFRGLPWWQHAFEFRLQLRSLLCCFLPLTEWLSRDLQQQAGPPTFLSWVWLRFFSCCLRL